MDTGWGHFLGKKEERRVRIVALSIGTNHYRDGNPGVEKNFGKIYDLAVKSLKEQPDLIVFPEFSTSGVPYSYDEAGRRLMRSAAEEIPGDGEYYNMYVELAKKGKCFVCGWLVEKENESVYHSTSFIINPSGQYLGKYRKVHPTEGEEYIWGCRPGDEFPVFDIGFAKVGIQICWDMDFPEGCRILMLKGADLLLHPTVANDRRPICPVRCYENHVPMIVSIYTWGSYALDEGGEVFADLSENKSEGGYLVADFNLSPSLIRKYGVCRYGRELLRFRRNPSAYGVIVDPGTHLNIREILREEDGSPLSHEKIKKKFLYI